MTNSRTIFVEPTTRNVSIMSPAPKSRRGAESSDAWLSRTEVKSNQDGARTKVERIDLSNYQFPNKALRSAWRIDQGTGKVKVDLNLAYRVRRQALMAQYRHWKKTVEHTLEEAQAFGDATVATLQSELTRVQGIPPLIKAELDRALADGDEAALGAWEPDWPTLGT